jgi:cytosine deaminase
MNTQTGLETGKSQRGGYWIILRNARLTSRPDQTLFDIGIEVAASLPLNRLCMRRARDRCAGSARQCGFVETHIHLDKSCLLDRCNAEKGDLDEGD